MSNLWQTAYQRDYLSEKSLGYLDEFVRENKDVFWDILYTNALELIDWSAEPISNHEILEFLSQALKIYIKEGK